VSPTSRRVRWLVTLVGAAILAAGAVLAEPSRSSALERLRDYVRIDTTNPPGNEAVAAEFLAGVLHDAGVASERHVSPAGRVTLLARLPATVPDAPAVALVHHSDVVPAGTGWRGEPFAAVTTDGLLVGRGAIDAKSLGIAHLEAFLAARDLPVRNRELVFLALADEESGGGEGMAWLRRARPELFDRVELALGEGGLNRTVLGRTFFWGLEVAQKRAYWLELVTSGRGSHGSSYNPDSAAHELVRGLAAVVDRPRRWRVAAPAREFLRALIAVEPPLQAAGADADAILIDGEPAPWFPLGYSALLLDTAQVTTLDADVQPNVVAPEARARLDVRLLPDTDAEAWLAELDEVLGRTVRRRTLLATPPSAPSPASGDDWERIRSVLLPEAPVLPVMIAGITDSRFFRELGITAYGLSPFAVDGLYMRRVHGPDEAIPLDAFDRGVERMKRIVRALLEP